MSPATRQLSQLSSVGVALERLADPNLAAGFAPALAKVPALLVNATAEVTTKLKPDNGRRNYTLALLR